MGTAVGLSLRLLEAGGAAHGTSCPGGGREELPLATKAGTPLLVFACRDLGHGLNYNEC